ncbi:MAG TPA: hypothetical protein P5538_10415 [Bacteroidales bacterium]|nr:hypothetical protein [Paludibacter sp.]HRT81341.1 hypothetical protein [Bacteroidales bacterium]
MRKEAEVKISVHVAEEYVRKEKSKFINGKKCFKEEKPIDWNYNTNDVYFPSDFPDIGPEIKCLGKLQDDFLSHIGIDEFLSMSDAVTIRKIKSWTEPIYELHLYKSHQYPSRPLFEITLHCHSAERQEELCDSLSYKLIEYSNYIFYIYYFSEGDRYSKIYCIQDGIPEHQLFFNNTD